MVWLAIGFSLAVAVVLLIARRQLAEMQALVVGGRIGPGCVIAEAALLALVAIAIFLLRHRL